MPLQLSPIPAVTDYVDQDYMETVRGDENIRKWSRKGGTQTTADVNAINVTIASATSQINGRLGRRYVVPLVNASASDLATLRRIAEAVASCELYIGRGIKDDDPVANLLRTQRDEALAELDKWTDTTGNSRMTLNADRLAVATSRAPELVQRTDLPTYQSTTGQCL